MSAVKKKCFKRLDNRVREEMNKYRISSGKTSENKRQLSCALKDGSRKGVSYGYRKRECGMKTKHRLECTRQETEFPVLCGMEVQCGEYLKKTWKIV